ncbi:MAG: transcriptional repressor LexA [Anaerolineales bacterium]
MMMVRKSKGLSDRHIKILELLQAYQDKGYPPSIREIGEQTSITSTSVVNYYLEQLEKWGYIERDRRISRGLRVTDKIGEIAGMFNNRVAEMLRVPIAGQIVAGAPAPVPASDFAYYDAESSLDIARSMLPTRGKTDDLYALEVKGDSMIDAMVNNGDYVIMKPVGSNAEVRNGEMVAVWLPTRDETTLKYFYKEKDGYRLQPANPTMKPIMIKSTEPLEIKGKVVMVIRKITNTAM